MYFTRKLEVTLPLIVSTWREGMEPIYQEYQSGERMEVNISRIKVWRKNGGKYIRYTNQYQEYRSKEGMKVNISQI